MNKLIIITLLSIPSISMADDIKCLSRILYAESQSESIEGIVALGQATIARSKRTKLSICNIHGVKRKVPPKRLDHYWIALAKAIIKDNGRPIIGDADSWNKGSTPSINHKDSKVSRKIGKHLFYFAGGELK